MVNTKLLRLVESVLGKGVPTSKGNVAFMSPFIEHRKPKLEINLDSGMRRNPWHCWVSDKKGKSLYSLFAQVKAPSHAIEELRTILGESKSLSDYSDKVLEKSQQVLSLPKEFTSLSSYATKNITQIKNPFVKNALWYLYKSRGITPTDILRYNIGFCDSGPYSGRIVIPSYDANDQLNYFVSRTYVDNPLKYKNPPVPRNIIPFESHIGWDFPVTIVEGVFDAIAVRSNAIPIFGKSVNDTLKLKLVQQGVPLVNVCLDNDAKKDGLRIVSDLKSIGINAKFIPMPRKDPADMGFEAITDTILNAGNTDFSQIIRLKLNV